MHRPHRTTALVLATVLLAGCGGAAATSEKPDSKAAGEPASSLLVVDGAARDGDEVGGEPARGEREAEVAPASNAVLDAILDATATNPDDPWPQPALLTDGTIDDGPDPFFDEVVPVQPMPIEDDPDTTRDIDAWSVLLRAVDNDEWDAWMAASVRRPFHHDELDPVLDGLVRISVERCGGAHTVATGAVVANETVVTTVHAIESAARRVRVSPAMGDAPRIPAMIRYLDIDDDVAVLKVPGLRMNPITWYAGGGSGPQRAYAYGVARGSQPGAITRRPALVAVEEESIDVEQPDGFHKSITDRAVFPMVGGIDSGFSGGVVTTTSDPDAITGFGVHGLIRARVPYREQTAGLVVPARIVREAVSESQALPPWFEHTPGGCPQWYR